MNDDKITRELPSYEGPDPYIFVSYSHRDTDKVFNILKVIDKEKYRFWYDDTMEIGEDFRDELRIRIEQCSAFLLFISQAALDSKYCGMEIITAFKNDKKIYPVYLDDSAVVPAPLKMILENLQHVKGSVSSDEKYIYKLISGLPTETMRSLNVEDGVLVKCKDGSTTLEIPEEVHTIGDSAFKNCEKLEKLEIGDHVRAMMREACRGCKALSEIVLPKNLRKVGDSAFRDCISMKKVVVLNDDLELGERSFENCASLSDVSLSDGVTELYGGVFNSCKSLESIKLPKKLTILGESSFADCVKLKAIDIPEHVTKIDDMVFNGCLELERIDLKEDLTKIGKYAFKDCKSLKTIKLPKNVQNIGAGAFRGCSNLEGIHVDVKNRYFKSLDGILFNKNKSKLICYPAKAKDKDYVVPDSVTTISDWAFCDCTDLVNIDIPDSVTEIGEGAFYGCTSLETVVLPESVVKIDDTAFRGCTALKTVVIPDSVIEFGWGLFSGCDEVVIICSNRSAAARYCELKNIPHKNN